MGNNWCMSNNRSSVGWSSLDNWSFWVDSCTFIGYISDISIIAIGMVGHML